MNTETIIKHINEDRISEVKLIGSWIEINEVYEELKTEIDDEYQLDSVEYLQLIFHADNQIYGIKEKKIKEFLKDKYKLKRLRISKQILKELIEHMDEKSDTFYKENEGYFNHNWE